MLQLLLDGRGAATFRGAVGRRDHRAHAETSVIRAKPAVIGMARGPIGHCSAGSMTSGCSPHFSPRRPLARAAPVTELLYHLIGAHQNR
jgi:hypothetical protein